MVEFTCGINNIIAVITNIMTIVFLGLAAVAIIVNLWKDWRGK